MNSRIRNSIALLLAAVLAALSSPATAGACSVALDRPVSGRLVQPFNPMKTGGHFGVDLAAPLGAVVRAPVSGKVTFAGRVAGMQSVTIAPTAAARVSLSYLSKVWVKAGRWVRVGQPLGRVGIDHGRAAVHLSLRLDGRYVDPELALNCRANAAPTRWRVRLLPLR